MFKSKNFSLIQISRVTLFAPVHSLIDLFTRLEILRSWFWLDVPYEVNAYVNFEWTKAKCSWRKIDLGTNGEILRIIPTPLATLEDTLLIWALKFRFSSMCTPKNLCTFVLHTTEFSVLRSKGGGIVLLFLTLSYRCLKIAYLCPVLTDIRSAFIRFRQQSAKLS